MSKTIDELIMECHAIGGTIPFLENYSHEDCLCWKVLNSFTEYKEDKIVLCKATSGIQHALETAIVVLNKAKNHYMEGT